MTLDEDCQDLLTSYNLYSLHFVKLTKMIYVPFSLVLYLLNCPGYLYFGLLVSTYCSCVKNLNPPPVWLKSSNSEDKVMVFYAIKCKKFIVI